MFNFTNTPTVGNINFAKILIFLFFTLAIAPVQAGRSGNSSGSLDGSFGTGGITITDISGSNAYDESYAIALQSTGKIISAGWSYRYSASDMVLTRHNSDGSLDTSFGTGGRVVGGFSDSDRAYAVAVQGDNKIVVVGHTYNAATGTGADFLIARYDEDGILDADFGVNGVVATDFGGDSESAYAIALQTDGKIVVAGSTNLGLAMARYDSTGMLDPGFGNQGKVVTNWGTPANTANDLAIQPGDGKIVVALFSADSRFTVVRYQANGQPDNAFGSNGKVQTNFGFGSYVNSTAIALQGSNIIAGGFAYMGSTSDIALVRYTGTGQIDPGFGQSGVSTLDISRNDDYAQDIVVQADGKIAAAGYRITRNKNYANIYDIAVARFLPDGGPDNGFGSGGAVVTNLGSTLEHGRGVALQTDGKIVVGGDSWRSGNGDFALVRYLP